MKTIKQIKPNYGPVYCAAMYPGLAKIFQKHGYALAVHGSLAKDLDLIAVPWVSEPDEHKVVLADMEKHFAIKQMGKPVGRAKARLVYSFSVGFGLCQLDLSFI